MNNSKPVFGTTEWAASNVNYLKGCSNDCKYCYSKEMSIRFKRKTPETWKNEEVTSPPLPITKWLSSIWRKG